MYSKYLVIYIKRMCRKECPNNVNEAAWMYKNAIKRDRDIYTMKMSNICLYIFLFSEHLVTQI